MNGRASGKRELSKRRKTPSTYRRVVTENGAKERCEFMARTKVLHLEPATTRRTA
jgi:hypothetical protein